jgi:hypothetical protein
MNGAPVVSALLSRVGHPPFSDLDGIEQELNERLIDSETSR